MSCKKIEVTQGTPEWHQWRGPLLGASDVAAVFGLSPHKTKRDLWFEKSGFGQADDEDRSFIFRRGHETEAEIREMFAKHTKIEMNPACFENEEIFSASLDGYDKNLGILEAKLVGKEALDRAAAGEIPEHHRIQVQAQLFVSESDKAFWGGRAPKVKGGVVVEIGRDEKLIKKIRDEGRKFMNMVRDGQTPELSASDILFITDPAKMAAFRALILLKSEKERIADEYEALDKQVKSWATHPKVRCLNVTITESERAGSIDYAKIPEVLSLAEDYLEKFRKKSSKVKTLTVKNEAKDE